MTSFIYITTICILSLGTLPIFEKSKKVNQFLNYIFDMEE